MSLRIEPPEALSQHAIHYASAPGPLGWVLAACTDSGLCWAALGDAADDLQADLLTRHPHATSTDDLPAVHALVALSSGREAAVPLHLGLTAFQERVHRALLTVPRGQTWTYTELAAQIGEGPTAARAVATACATNDVALAVPCHRILRTSGELAGYRWGLARKRRLLQLEGALPLELFG